MRARTLDILLMVGLFVVATAILWTLFTLGNDRGRPERAGGQAPPAASAPPEAGSTGDVLAIPPGAAQDADASGPGAAVPTDTATETGDAVADTATEATGPEPAIEPPSEIVPGEPIELQRVGFSFTTGGAGACGIVLEPWEHVAVSRDLLAAYGCGAEVTVELADAVAGRGEVTLVVADTMSPQFSRTANIYVAPDEPANQYGITEGVLRPE